MKRNNIRSLYIFLITGCLIFIAPVIFAMDTQLQLEILPAPEDDENQPPEAPSNNSANNGSSNAINTINDVFFNGYTTPNATLYFYHNEIFERTLKINTKGTFSTHFNHLLADDYTYILISQDTEGRYSDIVKIPFSLNGGDFLELNNIVLPPTLTLTNNEILPTEFVHVHGQAQANAQLNIIIKNNFLTESYTTQTTNNGKYNLEIPIEKYPQGVYSISIQSIIDANLKSPNTIPIPFLIIDINNAEKFGFKPADINLDGNVDIMDFNILMVYFLQPNFIRRADITRDNIVDIFDFTELLINWTE